MTTIYHNPRCSKSRQGLTIVEESGLPFEIVLYLDTPLAFSDLKIIIARLGISPIDLVRKGEAIWKEFYKGKEHTDIAIIQAMVDHPKLIERPIVVHGNKAVLGRPSENIEILLNT